MRKRQEMWEAGGRSYSLVDLRVIPGMPTLKSLELMYSKNPIELAVVKSDGLWDILGRYKDFESAQEGMNAHKELPIPGHLSDEKDISTQ